MHDSSSNPEQQFECAKAHFAAHELDAAKGLFTALEVVFQTDPSRLAEILHYQGLIALKEKKTETAAHYLKASLAQDANNAGGYHHYGNALHHLGDYASAANAYLQALALGAQSAGLYSDLAKLFLQQKDYEQAHTHIDLALAKDPDHPKLHYTKGNIFRTQEKYAKAADCFAKAVQLRPNYGQARHNHALSLYLSKDYPEALAAYESLLAANPKEMQYLRARGYAHYRLGHYALALADAHRVFQTEPDNLLARWLWVFSHLEAVYSSRDSAQSARAQFRHALAELERDIHRYPVDDFLQCIGYLQPFYLPYQNQDDTALIQQYGAFCSRVMALWQAEHVPIAKPQRAPRTKIRIGIVAGHFYAHSGWMAITRGIVTQLDKSQFEIYAFDLNPEHDDQAQALLLHATQVWQKPQNLSEWVRIIMDSDLDILLHPEPQYSSLSWQLACLRLVATQITTWGQPVTTGLPTIDYFLSAQAFEPADAQKYYQEKLHCLPRLGACTTFIARMPCDIHQIQAKLKPNALYILCPGATQKYHADFDDVLVGLCQELDQAQLNYQIVFFFKDDIHTPALLERMTQHFDNHKLEMAQRVIFLPQLLSDAFHSLLHTDVIALDTIGFSGYNTVLQIVECNTPMVAYEGEFMRGRFGSGILQIIGLSEWVAKNKQEFIALTVDLARHPLKREKIRAHIAAHKRPLFNDTGVIRALEQFLTDIQTGSAVSAPSRL